MNTRSQNSDYRQYHANTSTRGPPTNRALATLKMLRTPTDKVDSSPSSSRTEPSERPEERHELLPLQTVQSHTKGPDASWVPPHLRLSSTSNEVYNPPAGAIASTRSQHAGSSYTPPNTWSSLLSAGTENKINTPSLADDKCEELLIDFSDPDASVSAANNSSMPNTSKSASQPVITKLANTSSTNPTTSPPPFNRQLPPGVTMRIGPIWNVMVIDLNACNVNTFCEKFTKSIWGCKKKDKCDMVHDVRLRREYMKLHKPESKQKGKTNEENPEAESQGVVKNKDAEKKVIAKKVAEETEVGTKSAVLPSPNPWDSGSRSLRSYSSVVRTGLPKKPLVAKSPDPEKAWDHDEKLEWARRNLHPTMITKLTLPCILDGKVPKISDSPEKDRDAVFHYFGLLPGELRNKVWRYVQLAGSRDVKVRFTRNDAGGVSIEPMGPPHSFLLVNKEARSLAEIYCPKTFELFCSPKPTVYFRFNHDRLCINNKSRFDLVPLIQAMKPQHRHYIKWISLPLKDYISQPDAAMAALSLFKKVIKIWFLAGDAYEDRPFVKIYPGSQLKARLNYHWAKQWKDSRIKDSPPKCVVEIIPALEARQMKIDGLPWI